MSNRLLAQDSVLKTVNVSLANRAYDIKITSDVLLDIKHHIQSFLTRPKVAVVTDSTVADLHLGRVLKGLHQSGVNCVHYTIPAGEASKSWQQAIDLAHWLLQQKIERGDIVISLGGGVVGDLTGFVAAIVRRGVRYIQIPTSLLAQVDSAVGGKTGINTQFGKNLIGAFHQPVQVIIDIKTLDTLPKRHVLSGYGEVLKYALIGDSDFFVWLEKNGKRVIAGNRDARLTAVHRSCAFKAKVVANDETEQGDRALLNLGHTFGHALEAACGYSEQLLHGEAVVIGCVLAFDLAVRLGFCPSDDAVRVRDHINAIGMKTAIADIECKADDQLKPNNLLFLMQQDKKIIHGNLRLILPCGIGQSRIFTDIKTNDILAVLDTSCTLSA